MVGVSMVSPEGELLGGAYCAKAECKETLREAAVKP
jgi:hypothetical protein